MDLATADAFELSAAGPLVDWLRPRVRSLTTSEHFEGVRPGDLHEGILCQDVQRLTFDDASFDLCTSTEVFEHVEDDVAGFAEILRVLRPGGWHVFTVPTDLNGKTVERTTLSNGARTRALPAEYHADRYRGMNVFCYRNYGRDLLDRLTTAGFQNAAFRQPKSTLFGYTRPIAVAQKPA